jgi:DNA polymerase-3 subunit beta
MVNMTKFAVASNDQKPILTGELFEIKGNQFNMVSLDGYRLAIRTENINAPHDMNFVIKLKSLSDIVSLIKEKKIDEKNTETEKENSVDLSKKSGVIKIYLSRKNAAFEFDNFSIYTRLLEGEFHQYRRAIPSPERIRSELRVSVPELVRALERCQLLVDEKVKSPVRLTIKDDCIELSCRTPRGEISDVIPCSLTGETQEIGFNAGYLISALKSAETDEVIFKLIDGVSPMVVAPISGDAYLFLVLPIRLY